MVASIKLNNVPMYDLLGCGCLSIGSHHVTNPWALCRPFRTRQSTGTLIITCIYKVCGCTPQHSNLQRLSLQILCTKHLYWIDYAVHHYLYCPRCCRHRKCREHRHQRLSHGSRFTPKVTRQTHHTRAWHVLTTFYNLVSIY